MAVRFNGEARGFTLVELLVAVAVLAVIAAVSLRGLDSILGTQSHLQAEARRWGDIAMAMAQLSGDLAQAVSRPARDASGRHDAALLIKRDPDDAQPRLAITRLGRIDSAASLGETRRVGYRLRAQTLEYLIWPAVDSAPGETPSAVPMLENVTDLRLRALAHDGSWSPVWPGGGELAGLPRAVEIEVTLSSGERILRLFALR